MLPPVSSELWRRLDRAQGLVVAGGGALAFGVAFANTGVFLRTGTSVSHLTGDMARLSLDLVRASPAVLEDLGRVAAAVAGFFVGALLAGLLIHHPSLDFARPYGRIIIVIGGLFLLAWLLLPVWPALALAVAAGGCGLQNALATRYRGVILRTTHLTGLITDFGTSLGLRLRGADVPRWKVAVPGLLTLAFFAGGAAAAATAFHFGRDPLPLAGCAYLAAGLAWTAFKHWLWPRLARRRAAAAVEAPAPGR